MSFISSSIGTVKEIVLEASEYKSEFRENGTGMIISIKLELEDGSTIYTCGGATSETVVRINLPTSFLGEKENA